MSQWKNGVEHGSCFTCLVYTEALPRARHWRVRSACDMGFHPFCGLRPFVKYRPLTMRGGPPFGKNAYGMEAWLVLDFLWRSKVGNSAAMHVIARSVSRARSSVDDPFEAWPPGLL
jgi:hypothetical protein